MLFLAHVRSVLVEGAVWWSLGELQASWQFVSPPSRMRVVYYMSLNFTFIIISQLREVYNIKLYKNFIKKTSKKVSLKLKIFYFA